MIRRRVSELANIQAKDISWSDRTIQVLSKGRKESLATFGGVSEKYLKDLLTEVLPSNNIWGINKSAIQTMLRRLGEKTGLPVQPEKVAQGAGSDRGDEGGLLSGPYQTIGQTTSHPK